MTTLLGANDDVVATDSTHDWVECGEWIRELRPHINLYLLTDESIAAETEDELDVVYDRTFYRLNDVTDLYSTVLAGIRNRFATPLNTIAVPAATGIPWISFSASWTSSAAIIEAIVGAVGTFPSSTWSRRRSGRSSLPVRSFEP